MLLLISFQQMISRAITFANDNTSQSAVECAHVHIFSPVITPLIGYLAH